MFNKKILPLFFMLATVFIAFDGEKNAADARSASDALWLEVLKNSQKPPEWGSFITDEQTAKTMHTIACGKVRRYLRDNPDAVNDPDVLARLAATTGVGYKASDLDKCF